MFVFERGQVIKINKEINKTINIVLTHLFLELIGRFQR